MDRQKKIKKALLKQIDFIEASLVPSGVTPPPSYFGNFMIEINNAIILALVNEEAYPLNKSFSLPTSDLTAIKNVLDENHAHIMIKEFRSFKDSLSVKDDILNGICKTIQKAGVHL